MRDSGLPLRHSLVFFQIPVCTFTRAARAGKLACGGKPIMSRLALLKPKFNLRLALRSLNYGGEGRFLL